MRLNPFTLEQVKKMAYESLRQEFPLFREAQVVKASALDLCNTVEYGEKTPLLDRTYFYAAFYCTPPFPHHRVGYISFLGIEDKYKQNPVEEALYRAIHDLAWRFGCHTAISTPLHHGPRNKKKYLAFLKKMGYRPDEKNPDLFNLNLESISPSQPSLQFQPHLKHQNAYRQTVPS